VGRTAVVESRFCVNKGTFSQFTDCVWSVNVAYISVFPTLKTMCMPVETDFMFGTRVLPFDPALHTPHVFHSPKLPPRCKKRPPYRKRLLPEKTFAVLILCVLFATASANECGAGEISLQERCGYDVCPTYDFPAIKFQGGATYVDTTGCDLCVSRQGVSLLESSSQYVALGATTVGGDITAMAWVYMHSLGFIQPIFSFSDGNWQSTMKLTWTSTNYLEFTFATGGTRLFTYTGGDRAVKQTWTHIALTFNLQDEKARIYFNGVIRGTSTSAAFPLGPTPIPVQRRTNSFLGRHRGGSYLYADMTFSDFRFYERALTGAEISSAYGGETYAADVHALGGMLCSTTNCKSAAGCQTTPTGGGGGTPQPTAAQTTPLQGAETTPTGGGGGTPLQGAETTPTGGGGGTPQPTVPPTTAQTNATQTNATQTNTTGGAGDVFFPGDDTSSVGGAALSSLCLRAFIVLCLTFTTFAVY